jgi:hypothetical protein
MEPDFGGYVTRYGVKCTDGRTIKHHAFKGQDGLQVPLVWQHQHDSADNVLGHLLLRHMDDGVRVDGFFNSTPQGVQAKALVQHKDITNLSIYAGALKQNGMDVTHGQIREGSLVLAGANPGAHIDYVNMVHSDGSVAVVDGEAVIYTNDEISLEPLVHAAPSITVPGGQKVPGTPKPPMPQASGGDGPSVEEVFNSLSDVQKNVVYALVGAAAAKHTAGGTGEDPTNTLTHDQKGDGAVTRNVFDQTDATKTGTNGKNKVATGHTLSHADQAGIFAAAIKGGSLKEAVEDYALAHGIDNIETMFPEFQAISDTPDFISRRMEWVAGVLGGVHHTPFSRIKSLLADITMDEARAKGYIKGNMKKEEFFSVTRRETTPKTVYKKQKLDRDDVSDITDFDVVAWLQTEMRVMLDEEIARAILIGDGRDVDDDDKIDEDKIRPILTDDEIYVTTLDIATSAIASTADSIIDAVVNGMRYYRGSGNPTFFTTRPYLSKLLLIKDTLGRRLYPTTTELAAAMGVSSIIPVEAMESRTGLIGIIVNLTDYNVGADRLGAVSMFDFFDIDFNQFKYLIETRISGALTKFKSAIVVNEFSGAGGVLPEPTAPTFVNSTGVGTIPTTTHVTYVTVASDGTESSALTAGAQTAIAAGASVHYRAKAAATYSFPDDVNDEWFFTRDAS